MNTQSSLDYLEAALAQHAAYRRSLAHHEERLAYRLAARNGVGRRSAAPGLLVCLVTVGLVLTLAAFGGCL